MLLHRRLQKQACQSNGTSIISWHWFYIDQERKSHTYICENPMPHGTSALNTATQKNSIFRCISSLPHNNHQWTNSGSSVRAGMLKESITQNITNTKMLLPLSQTISQSNFLGESKHFRFDQNYRENYKDLWHQIGILWKYNGLMKNLMILIWYHKFYYFII